MNRISNFIMVINFVFVLSFNLVAQQFDLSNATILVSSSIKSPVRETVARVLEEEIQRRTKIILTQSDSWDEKNDTYIAIALAGDQKLMGKDVPQRHGVKRRV